MPIAAARYEVQPRSLVVLVGRKEEGRKENGGEADEEAGGGGRLQIAK
jgi:hypothetical protein